ncbi:hypothetical protein [Macrococcoides canis]|uniref:hypothetical protein n=1 Tax=Macrococcoides canis TaxID=1855823 RepID=UPI00165DDB8E|nr:hypothetical protein [Macrococcus canis]QNR06995.1 hypothetical protein GL258_01565 [Macrococcus canis]
MIDMNAQMHVYEYLGKENDPLYNNIMHLKANQSIQIAETKMQITKLDLRCIKLYWLNSTNVIHRPNLYMNRLML